MNHEDMVLTGEKSKEVDDKRTDTGNVRHPSAEDSTQGVGDANYRDKIRCLVR